MATDDGGAAAAASEAAEAAPGGIHHVTAICGDPQANLDFYGGLLGLRLVKKTVNFDDPGTYHLYYGDGVGSPGTLMTFFAWIGTPPMGSARGRQGLGAIGATSFRVPPGALSAWVDRLASAAIDFEGPARRGDEELLALRDPDGLPLELVAAPGEGPGVAWSEGPVAPEHAIRGIHGVALRLRAAEPTVALLTRTLGFQAEEGDGDRRRLHVGGGAGRSAVDLVTPSGEGPARMGVGLVHHVAFRTASRVRQEEWRGRVSGAGVEVTPVLDRCYFESIYFREPGGVLFEIATDPPGFSIDERVADLGSGLMLPPWLEARRDRIEAALPALRAPSRSRAAGAG